MIKVKGTFIRQWKWTTVDRKVDLRKQLSFQVWGTRMSLVSQSCVEKNVEIWAPGQEILVFRRNFWQLVRNLTFIHWHICKKVWENYSLENNCMYSSSACKPYILFCKKSCKNLFQILVLRQCAYCTSDCPCYELDCLGNQSFQDETLFCWSWPIAYQRKKN